MNRMEEYQKLLDTLQEVPASDPVGFAKRRLSRKRALWRPMISVAAVLCVFIGLVNLSPTVAAACREIPFLAELTELLTFNPSLRTAVENDYIQLVGQTKTENGITVTVEHLIVDQKQVNIFYRASWEEENELGADFNVLNADGTDAEAILLGSTAFGQELSQITVDYVDRNVPGQLKLVLMVFDTGRRNGVAAEPLTDEPGITAETAEPNYLAEMTFDLTFDPQYTEQGRTVTLNREFELDGQRFMVADMQIYPSHIRVNLSEDEDNTAWLTSLRFYLELENGRKVETISNGISATGSPDTESMLSFRAESSYFDSADCIRIVITGADLLEKDKDTVRIDLENLESEPLPEGVILHGADRRDEGWELTLRLEDTEIDHVQVLDGSYFDADGAEFSYIGFSSSTVVLDETGKALKDWTEERYTLSDFRGTEAWFALNYTHFWEAETPVIIELHQ